MVTNMTSPTSTNTNGTRGVCVVIVTDGQETTATIEFLICATTLSKEYKIPSGRKQQKCCVQHTETGRCVVKATETNSGKSKDSFLDLDAAQSP